MPEKEEPKKKIYNLEERTALFAQEIIDLCKTVPQNIITSPMLTQLIKSATSQAANYYEATEAESPKDFFHKIGIAKKEIKETKLWLRLISMAHPPCTDRARLDWREAHELNLIFASIRNKRNTHPGLKIENS